MDLRQVEYIVKIAEENNITRAAEKIFITQSALNQQLLKLEKELGTALFYRGRANWQLTPAGEIYISSARELLRIKKETYARIHDLAEEKHELLSIGFTATRGIDIFSSVYPLFHKNYPNVVVTPVERTSRELQTLIANHTLDIAFLTLSDCDKTKDEYLALKTEELFLLLPEGHPLCGKAAPAAEGGDYPTMDPVHLDGCPFAIANKESTMRPLLDLIFRDAGVTPKILFETKSNITIIKMVQAVGCGAILPEYYLTPPPAGIRCFHLPSRPSWQMVATWRRGSYLTEVARTFIRLVQELLA